MKNSNLIIAVLSAIIVGGICFFGGMKYQESKTKNMTASLNQGGFGARGGRGVNGGFVAGAKGGLGLTIGQIISIDSKSMTIKMSDGSSKIVNLSDTTKVMKSEAGSITDLKSGIQIGVSGTKNTDGSITAQMVQLNPMIRMKK
jgi:hypothetical protein